MARATEKKLLQINERVEQTVEERKKFIKKDLEELKKRQGNVNEKLWSLDTRMDTMSRELLYHTVQIGCAPGKFY